MKVYIVTEWRFSDATTVIGVYATEEEAKARVERELQSDPETQWHGFEMEEHDLIGSAS